MSSCPLTPEKYDRGEVESIRRGETSVLTVHLSGDVGENESVSDAKLTLYLIKSGELHRATVDSVQIIRSLSGVDLLFDAGLDCLGDDYRDFVRRDALDMIGGSTLEFIFGSLGEEYRYEFVFEPERLIGKFRWKEVSRLPIAEKGQNQSCLLEK